MEAGDLQKIGEKISERVGRYVVAFVEEIGNGGILFLESIYWLFLGRREKQPIRLNAVVMQMMEIGINAIPIIAVLAATISVTLTIQGIYTLRVFGAEDQVTFGIGFSVVREFAPLITGILVAGRSGSALAARIGIMKINQEIDALKVMGINPTRFLVVPPLIAMFVMLPLLTFMADFVGLFFAGLYVNVELGISMAAYAHQLIEYIEINDVFFGLLKSVIFAIEITIIAVINGASVVGGAEGVGKATTRAVVQSISAIVLTAMLVVLISTRT